MVRTPKTNRLDDLSNSERLRVLAKNQEVIDDLMATGERHRLCAAPSMEFAANGRLVKVAFVAA